MCGEGRERRWERGGVGPLWACSFALACWASGYTVQLYDCSPRPGLTALSACLALLNFLSRLLTRRSTPVLLTALPDTPDPTQPHAQGARGRHHRRPFKATHAPWPLLELAQAPKRAPTSLELLQAALRPCRPMHSPQPAAERDTSKQSNVRAGRLQRQQLRPSNISRAPWQLWRARGC